MRAGARQDLTASADARHIAMDGKTIRASKDGEGEAVHVFSAFCGGLRLQKVLARGNARRGHGNSGRAQASACDQRREAERADAASVERGFMRCLFATNRRGRGVLFFDLRRRLSSHTYPTKEPLLSAPAGSPFQLGFVHCADRWDGA